MEKQHERSTAHALERAADTGTTGEISGVLATDGEASDGDILHIPGGEMTAPMPLMFGHDDLPFGDALRHLGSWTAFSKSEHEVRGTARIEMDVGEGGSLEFRKDVAAMIGAGHINALSIRWEPTKPPVRRVNLPSDHYAAVDGENEKDPRKRYGYFYPAWRGLEGSIVTLGADRDAMIARAWHSPVGPEWGELLKAEDRAEVRAELIAELREMEVLSPSLPTGSLQAANIAELLIERIESGETVPGELLIRIAGGDIPSLDDAPAPDPAPVPTPVVRAPTPSEIAQVMREAVEGDRKAVHEALMRELTALVGG